MLLIFALMLASANAAPPDNRPPDNRPPDRGGSVTGSVESVIENTVDLNSTSNAVSDATASATIEAGAIADGDVNLDTRSLALMNTMGDVDINDCRESEQFGTPLFSRQWIALNPWCAAEVYDAKGLHELAARTRCTIKEIKRLFDTDAECVAANTVQATAPLPPAPVIHDRDEELERRLEINQAYTAELESRLNDLERLAQRAPTNKTVVQQVPYLSADKRAKLAELRDE